MCLWELQACPSPFHLLLPGIQEGQGQQQPSVDWETPATQSQEGSEALSLICLLNPGDFLTSILKVHCSRTNSYSRHQCNIQPNAGLETSTENRGLPDPQRREPGQTDVKRSLWLMQSLPAVCKRAYGSRVKGTKTEILHCVIFSEGRHLKAKKKKKKLKNKARNTPHHH